MSGFGQVRCPGPSDRVYKEYCLYSFDTPLSENGLYICMRHFFGVSRRYLELYHEKTGSTTFLHWKQVKTEKKPDEDKEHCNGTTNGSSSGPTRMAIGVAGGFNVDENKSIETSNSYEIVLFPEMTRFPLDDSAISAEVRQAAQGIIDAPSPGQVDNTATSIWDGEIREISRHSFDLVQLPTDGKAIAPSGWKCERCDKTNNLWLNLSDGSILCGRKNYDGSGGNNHALDHFQECNFPLAVKLGTITPKGADVFSYDEGDMVQDPLLVDHLAHWGIDVNKIEKSDKTMAEMEIELNNRMWEYRLLEQPDKKLTPVFGPGLTPITNLGNTCYFNSVVQVLFSLDDFVNELALKFDAIARQVAPGDSIRDMRFQLAKLGSALISGEYSKPPPTKKTYLLPTGIEPQTFKACIGQVQAEYASSRQQDAHEFLLFLLQQVEQIFGTSSSSTPSKAFEFELRQAIVANPPGRSEPLAKFMFTPESVLGLNLDIEPLNKKEFEEFEQRRIELEAKGEKIDPENYVRKRFALNSLIQAFSHPVTLEGLKLNPDGAPVSATSFSSMATFPDCLIIQIKKFGFKSDWSPYKMDVEIDAPDRLDVEALFQQSENLKGVESLKLLPEPVIEKVALQSLVEMGFSRIASMKGLYYTASNGRRNLEAAINWLMEHSSDADIEQPIAEPVQVVESRSSASLAGSGGVKRPRMSDVNPELIEQIVCMGFTQSQAKNALAKSSGSVERAIEYIFNNPDEAIVDSGVEPMEEAGGSSSQQLPQDPTYRNGAGKYELLGFISHMGASPHSGHYVAHLRKNGVWVLFNDDHVTACEEPPRQFGYLYFYKRVVAN